MKKTITTVIIILISLAGFIYIINRNKQKNQEKTDIVAQKNAKILVRVAKIENENVSLGFSANGNFAPIQEMTFSAEKPGKVIDVLVKEGSSVRVGQTLAIVRSDIISVQVNNALAFYNTSKADYNRFENAFKTGGVTKQQLDQAKMNMINAESQLKQAQISFGDTKIKSTINGIINKKYIEPGSVLAGMPSSPMFEIVNVSKLKLKVDVNESNVANLHVGNTVDVTTSVYPEKTFLGKIVFIAPKSDSSLNFPVEVEITNNAKNDLKAGMYGTANFDFNHKKQSLLLVPRSAFVGSVSSNQIFVLENGMAKLKNVVSGRIFGDKVEIKNGLKAKNIVIITGQINLQDGSEVEIIK